MYDPANWYWQVGADRTQVWSSKRTQYVPTSDADYSAWCANGHQATATTDIMQLYNVLMSQWAPQVIAQGVTLSSSATPSLDGVYALDDTSQHYMAAISAGIAAGKPLPGGGGTFLYRDASGQPHAFAAADFLNFAVAVENYIYQFGLALETRLIGTAPTDMPSSTLSIP